MVNGVKEKRSCNRIPLDIPLFIILKTEDSQELPVQMLDCGRGGMRLAFAPKDEKYSRGMLDNRVYLMHLPKGMDPVDRGKAGKVAWTGGGRCGICFDAPLMLSDGEMREVSQDYY